MTFPSAKLECHPGGISMKSAFSSWRANWSVPIIVFWFTCLILGSFLPRWKTLFHTGGRLHLSMHFAAFAFSGFIAFGFVPARTRRVLSCIGLIGLAFFLEALQRVVYPIRFEWRDFMSDVFGILAGLLFTAIYHSRPNLGSDCHR
jgi:hypothetical protein